MPLSKTDVRKHERQIAQLSGSNLAAGIFYAQFSQHPSRFEAPFRLIYVTTGEVAMINKAAQKLKRKADKRLRLELRELEKRVDELIKMTKQAQSGLERQIKKAILQKDYSTLQEMASAVMFFKVYDPNQPPVFPLHYKILTLRQECECIGKKMTVREVAEHLKGGDAGKDDGGFRNLRRLCIKLHFPLKVISRKRRLIHKKKAEQAA